MAKTATAMARFIFFSPVPLSGTRRAQSIVSRSSWTLECARVVKVREGQAGIAGWAVVALLLVLAMAGAASSPDGLVLGVPSPAVAVLAVAATLALAALAGVRAGAPAIGVLPLVLLIFSGLPIPGLGALTGPPLMAVGLALAAVALSRASPAWARRAFIPVLVAVHMIAAARVQRQVGPEGDEPHYLMVSASILRDGDLALQDDYAAGRYREFHPADLEPHYRVRGREGDIYSLHAIGLSLIILPAYAVGGYAAASFFMALLGVAAAWQVRELVRDVLPEGTVADAAGWIAGLSPPLMHFAGLVFTEVPAALGLTVAMRAALAAPSASRAWGAGLVLAALPWLNVRYAILAAIVVVAALARRPVFRVAAGWMTPGVVSAVALALYHQALYGFADPRRVYGRRPEFSSDVVPTGLPGLFFDQEFGLLAYAPVFVLAVPGLVRLARTQRRAAGLASGLVVAVVAVAAAWPMWRGGFNPPARFLLPVLPALVVGMACWLKRGWTFPAALLVGWGLWTGLAAVADRDLVHRDRDGTAPFFRAHSGATEWTRLLPGYVLEESARDRRPLTLVWLVALAAAAAARKPATTPRVAIGCACLLAATATASALGQGRSQGRDATRVMDRGSAAWSPGDLEWGPLYEPHRHPAGAEVGSRLALSDGLYVLEMDVDPLGSTASPPVLQVRTRTGSAETALFEDLPGLLVGRVDVAGKGPVTLAIRGGGPLILKQMRLRRSTFSSDPGPTE
jgi:hypothetical protein